MRKCFQLVKEKVKPTPTDKEEEEMALCYTVKQHATIVTCTIVSQDFPPQQTKGIDPNKTKQTAGETRFRPIHCKKCLGTINVIKRQFMQRLNVE